MRIKLFYLFAFCVLTRFGFADPIPSRDGEKRSYNFSVVKVEVTSHRYSYEAPWQVPSQSSGWGTGFVTDSSHVVTNAHVIESPAFIKVQLAGERKFYTATLETIDRDCDLALIKVEDSEFSLKAQPLELAKECFVGLDIFTLGYPLGGEELCLSKGAITRQEMRSPNCSDLSLLMAEIDAYMNFGSSGSPVFNHGGLIVGVISSFNPESRICQIISLPVLKHFLVESKKPIYLGFPFASMGIMKTENPDLRTHYQLSDSEGGVLVVDIPDGSVVVNILFPGDIILEIDDHKINCDGTFEYFHGEKINSLHLSREHFYGENVKIKIKRQGQILILDIPLKKLASNDAKLVSTLPFNATPRYVILGGLVFQPLTYNYLFTWGKEWQNESPLDLRYFCEFGQKTKDREEIVILTEVLPSELTMGYESFFSNVVVSSMNGVPVRSLAHFAELMDQCKDDYFKIHLRKGEAKLEIILDRKKVLEKQQKILEMYQIPAARSKDLQ